MKRVKKILLIDDDPISIFISEKLLTKLDIADQVKVCKNGKEGLDFLSQECLLTHKQCPELIILDKIMPVMDGMEFLLELNKIDFDNKDQFVVLVLSSGSYKEGDIQKFKELGVKEFSEKPLSEEMVKEIADKYWGE